MTRQVLHTLEGQQWQMRLEHSPYKSGVGFLSDHAYFLVFTAPGTEKTAVVPVIDGNGKLKGKYFLRALAWAETDLGIPPDDIALFKAHFA